jgi:hypothetical protein
MSAHEGGEVPAGPTGTVRTVKLIKGHYYSVPWGNPRVGTPWIAEIVGTDPKYGLARKFLRAVVVEERDATYLVDVKDMKIGSFYEVKNPSSWRHPDLRFYFRVLGVDTNTGTLTVEYIEKKDLIIYFRERDSPMGNEPMEG